MWYYMTKLVISAALIVAVSEVAKRSPMWGGMIASLPLVSLLGFIWLYIDTRDVAKVAALSWSILWLVIPSLALFIALPLLLKKMPFAPSLALATLIMFACYGITVAIVKQFGGQA